MLKYLIAVGLFGLVHAQFQSGIVYLFDPTGKSQVTGNVTFTQTRNGVHVEGEVQGLAPGLHGFHVHNLGNIVTGCTATAGHFNPHKKTHGAPEDSNRHVGDLGNIVADQSGVAKIDLIDNVIALGGQNCIIGRGVVVHEKADDLGKGGNKDSLVTGNAGGRLACGVIGVLQSSGAKLSLTNGLLAIIVLIGFIL